VHGSLKLPKPKELKCIVAFGSRRIHVNRLCTSGEITPGGMSAQKFETPEA
jgi:hypothetical protein